MYANQYRFLSDISPFIRAICSNPLLFCRKGIRWKMTVLGRHIDFYTFVNNGLCFQAVGNQILNTNDLDIELLATSTNCGRRAIVPSSLMISINAPAG